MNASISVALSAAIHVSHHPATPDNDDAHDYAKRIRDAAVNAVYG